MDIRTEYVELKEKTLELKELINHYQEEPQKTAYGILFEQLIYMRNYLKILKIRADIEGIELEGE